jgi:hypothetical protein
MRIVLFSSDGYRKYQAARNLNRSELAGYHLLSAQVQPSIDQIDLQNLSKIDQTRQTQSSGCRLRLIKLVMRLHNFGNKIKLSNECE